MENKILRASETSGIWADTTESLENVWRADQVDLFLQEIRQPLDGITCIIDTPAVRAAITDRGYEIE